MELQEMYSIDPWVGLANFVRFFKSVYFVRLIKNTILLSVYNLIFGFPAPIILALLLNEVRNKHFKNITQTITYLPHFISLIVVTGMLTDFSMTSGLFNDIIAFFGGERSPLLQNPKLYRTMYVASGIWQQVGWGSIIYLSALAGVDQQLYEAASIDGAGAFKKFLYITIPGIKNVLIFVVMMTTIAAMKLFTQPYIMTNGGPKESTMTLTYYLYRQGFQYRNMGYASAVSVIFFIVVVGISVVVKKLMKAR